MLHFMDLRAASPRTEIDRNLDAILAANYGLIDQDRALAAGATVGLIKRRVSSAAWIRVHRSVYRDAAVPAGPEQEHLAAVWACGPGATVSHRSAAWLWELLAAPPAQPDISVPADRTVRHRGIQLHRSSDVVAAPIARIRGIPVTDASRTILDAARALSPFGTQIMVDRAIARKLVTADSLLDTLNRYGRRGRGGTGTLRAVLAARGVSSASHAPSVLESAMARLIRLIPVAPPLAEYVVAGGRFRFDFAWPEILVAVEVNGWQAHSSFKDWQRDHAKSNWASANGWIVARFTWEDVVHRPEATATALLRIINQRRLAA